MRQILLQSLSYLARQLGLLALSQVLAATGLLVAANTDPGLRLLAWGIGAMSGGQVLVEALSGSLPAAPRVRRIELRSEEGAWLVIDEAALDLDLRALVRGEIGIDELSARSVQVHRLPSGDGEGLSWPRLPLRIGLARFAVEDLQLAPAFPGAPPLAIEGRAVVGGPGPQTVVVEALAPHRPHRYHLHLEADPDGLRVDLGLEEARAGLLPALAGPLGWQLPTGIEDWRFRASAHGPYAGLELTASLTAGPIQASAEGTLDLEGRSAEQMHLRAQVPAMALPSPYGPIAWTDLALSAALSGPWKAPLGQAHLEAQGLTSGDLGLDRLTLSAQGNRQGLDLTGELQGLQAGVPLPPSARRAPLRISAHLGLADPSLPFDLDIDHPLVALAATGTIEPPAARARVELPDLAPLAQPADLRLAGRARLDISADLDGTPALNTKGVLTLTEAPGPLPGLLGPEAYLALALSRQGDGWRVDSMEIHGAGIRVGAQGTMGPEKLSLGWNLDLPDLALVATDWTGRLTAQGGVSGPPRAPDLVADVKAQGAYDRAGSGQVRGRMTARLAEPNATLHLAGDWAGQPLRLDLRAGPGPTGDLRIDLRDARWASVTASGDLRLAPGSALPQGELRLDAGRLADLTPFLAPAMTRQGEEPLLDGRLGARLRLEGVELRVDALGDGLVLPGSIRIGALAMDAELQHPWETTQSRGQLRLAGLALGTATGDLTLSVQGPVRDLGWTADSILKTALGPAHLGMDGRLDTIARRLTVQRMEVRAADRTLRLLDPTHVELAAGLRVDRLRLGLGEGTLELTGRLLPPLATEARLTRLPLDLVGLAAPDLPLAGTLDGEIRVTGPIDALSGTARLQAEGLRLAQGAARALPTAALGLVADLGPGSLRVDLSAEAGKGTRLALRGHLRGKQPFVPETIDLTADGRVDLGLLDPLLTASGRQAAGLATLDARITGSRAAPRLAGALSLRDGAFWDRANGLVLTEGQGRLTLAGDVLRLDGVTARAGPGRLDLAGTVGALAPGIPLDLRLTARDVSPFQLDRLKVLGSGDIRLTGQALGRMEAAGSLQLDQVEIHLPERLPAEVVTLQVREVGQRRGGDGPVPAGWSWRPDLGLDLGISAPRSVEVRGRGVEAELGGAVRVRGTLQDPVITGGFDLRRGEYDLVGQPLRFSRGRLSFDGATGLNPSLDLESRVSTAGSTAILAVEGTAQAPRIALRGEPEMPQDEVLSRLLFGVPGGRLTPWQATRLGLAAASLAGIQVEGPGLLDRLRQGLGLDRLSGGTGGAGGATAKGGRQLSERVYLGARQGGRTGEPQGVVRVEVSPRIRLEADISPIGGTRAGAAFELEY